MNQRAARSKRYFVDVGSVEPVVFYVLTDNWLEMTVRFLTEVHGVRFVKDQLYRMVLDRFQAEGIDIASSTFAVVELPPVKVQIETPDRVASPSR